MKNLMLDIEPLEERIAPSCCGHDCCPGDANGSDTTQTSEQDGYVNINVQNDDSPITLAGDDANVANNGSNAAQNGSAAGDGAINAEDSVVNNSGTAATDGSAAVGDDGAAAADDSAAANDDGAAANDDSTANSGNAGDDIIQDVELVGLG